MAKALKVGVIGASGYGGGELLRLLFAHPNAHVQLAAAGEHAGERIDALHPNLRGLTQSTFSAVDLDALAPALADLDCLFLALPHGRAMALMPSLPSHLKVIDLSGDFRLSNGDVFDAAYGFAHSAMGLQRDFVYGLPELFRDEVKTATRVANPGCFATAVILGLAPLARAGLIGGTVIADAKTGSSGSGAKPGAGTHHPTRAMGLSAYKPFTHQHQPEIEQALGLPTPLVFQTHSVPIVRGIYASLYVPLRTAATSAEIGAVFNDHYGHEPFVRLLAPDTCPNATWSAGSNFVDVGFAARGSMATVFVALDNLMKGAAGQAVQNFNLIHGLPETTGLMAAGHYP
jgi:N-acetyl-gamma-glutamyl-phosphate reductase common form